MWGGGTANRSTRLDKALVETELASDVDCAVSSTVDPFTFSFEATVREGQHPDEVEQAVLAEIQRAMDEPVSEAELHKAIKQNVRPVRLFLRKRHRSGVLAGLQRDRGGRELVRELSRPAGRGDRGGCAACRPDLLQAVAAQCGSIRARGGRRHGDGGRRRHGEGRGRRGGGGGGRGGQRGGDGDAETGDTATWRWRAMIRRSSMMKLNNPGFASSLPASPRRRVAAPRVPPSPRPLSPAPTTSSARRCPTASPCWRGELERAVDRGGRVSAGRQPGRAG